MSLFIKKSKKPLFVFTLIALLGFVALSDFKNFRSHKKMLQSAADNGALSIAKRVRQEEKLNENFKISLTDISQELMLEEFLYAEWIEGKKFVKITASLPFKGMVLRKKISSKDATVKVSSFLDND